LEIELRLPGIEGEGKRLSHGVEQRQRAQEQDPNESWMFHGLVNQEVDDRERPPSFGFGAARPTQDRTADTKTHCKKCFMEGSRFDCGSV
jgi:hypothetical protein